MTRAILALVLAAGAACGIVGWAMQVAGGEGSVLAMLLPLVSVALLGAALLALRPGGRLRASGGSLRLCAYLLLAAAVAQVLWVTPFEPRLACLAFSAALALAAALLLRRGPDARPSTALRIADVVAAAACIALVGAELTLRVAAAAAPKPVFAQRDLPPAERIEHHRYRPGAVVDGTAANAAGFVGPSFEPGSGGTTAVVVGDRTLGGGLPFELGAVAVATRAASVDRIVPRQLEGLSTPEYRVLALEALAQGPRALVVVLDLGSDLGELDRIESGWRVLASWLDRENVLLTRVYDHVLRRMRERELLGIGESAAEPRIATTADELARDFPWVADPSLEQPRLSDERLDELTLATLRVHDRPAARIERALVDLEVIAASCRERGVGFGVLLVPARHQVDRRLWDRLRGSRSDAARDAATLELRRRLEAAGIETLDLTATLRSAEAAARRTHVFHAGDLRLNAHGNRLAGEALAVLVDGLARQDGR